MTPVYCKVNGRLYWIGAVPNGMDCTVAWISLHTGIDPDNVEKVERQPKRWFVTLVKP